MFGGQVGIVGHLRIGDKVYCGGKAGISGDKLAKKGNISLMGYPGVEAKEFAKQSAALKRLPDLLKEVEKLKREIEELKNNK